LGDWIANITYVGIGIFAGVFIMMALVLEFPGEITFLTELIDCDILKEQAVFLKTHLSKNYIMEECF